MVLQLHNYGENFTLNSLSNDFPTTTVQSAADCFGIGRTTKKFFVLAFIAALRISRRFRSRFQFNQFTDGDDNLLDELSHEDDPTTDDDGDNLICELILNADNYQLCKAKTAYDAVLEKINTSLAEKTLTATEVPHLDTKALLTKLVNVAKTVGLDVSTILA